MENQHYQRLWMQVFFPPTFKSNSKFVGDTKNAIPAAGMAFSTVRNFTTF